MTQQLRLALSQVESNLRERQFVGREDRSKQIQNEDGLVYFQRVFREAIERLAQLNLNADYSTVLPSKCDFTLTFIPSTPKVANNRFDRCLQGSLFCYSLQLRISTAEVQKLHGFTHFSIQEHLAA